MPVDRPSRPFLTAEWRFLIMLNYAVDASLVAHLVPAGTELDQFGGCTYISLVGFRFERTRLHGLWIPFHSDFDEVNLRFYVKRKQEAPPRRGVVFVREVVPRWAIAKTAQLAFREKYVSLPMKHKVVEPTSEGGRVQAEYRWRHGQNWNSLRVECAGRPVKPADGSLEQFLTEHYWGYSAQPGGATLEYHVEHDPWRVWQASRASFEGEAQGLYGAEFARCLAREPDSSFMAEGSTVAVYPGQALSP
ncbi:MAG TPA: DUF2071 domain-containing protein [Bryobacteraceae bacterium]|nr:DUF2071 domain-containing protein [Bryobacteraceae bacterium]